MRVLKSWLKDYIKIPYSTDQLIEKLNVTGTEVDAVSGQIDDKVIVVEIKEIKPHPNADRLRLARVSDGTAEYEVVCGAPNIEVGQKVPLAKEGALLTGGIELKKAVIRGVESNGMLCALDELGLGEDHSGIIILPETAELGQPASKYLPSDVVFELEITPNRGDCLSHLGVAREISAFSNEDVQLADAFAPQGEKPYDVTIKAVEECPQYFALSIDGITIKESPEWLKSRLTKVGLRPINNVVDVTNYILMDVGQPLHAFDADKLASQHIIVRLTAEGETITTLDGTDRKLTGDMLVIADTNKPIAIAGVMGGKNSEVGESTTNIVLEAAEFDRKSIRRTAKKLGLMTDASYRFERGIDPDMVVYALEKAANMILELAGGTVTSSIIRKNETIRTTELAIEYDTINTFLGLDLSIVEINDILHRLGFTIMGNIAAAPTWRHDISCWQDLAEEVGRIYGYHQIPHQSLPEIAAPESAEYYVKEYVKDLLVKHGFSEVYNYPFLSADDIKTAGIATDGLIEVANPVQMENKYLRIALIPGLLKSISKNPIFDPVLLFEFGRVFDHDTEQLMLGIVATGKNARENISAIADSMSNEFSIERDSITVRELRDETIMRYKIRKPVVYAIEIPFDLIAESQGVKNKHTFNAASKEVKFRTVSKYPAVTRDLAFVIDRNIDTCAIIDSIYNISDTVVLVEQFDEFVSDKLGENKKSVAFHVYLQKLDRTLTDEGANAIERAIVQKIEEEFKAKLRE